MTNQQPPPPPLPLPLPHRHQQQRQLSQLLLNPLNQRSLLSPLRARICSSLPSNSNNSSVEVAQAQVLGSLDWARLVRVRLVQAEQRTLLRS